ncbi:MAG: hypothetical protein NTZ92_01555 [Candidatus Omnitrophica bacterium]|nr:hypothetical protein [Candidatus Omnitrophota bacterium]
MRKNETVEYGIDPSGRLKIMRVALDGEFDIDRTNALTYRVKQPLPSGVPQQLRLSGKWSLDNGHNLALTLDRENNPSADKLTLAGEIIDARADELAFSITSKDSTGRTHLSILKLSGKWQVDAYNRLSFLIAKENDLYDTLILVGAWEVNKQNQIIYTYTKTGLKRKEKIAHSITFKGYWDITEKNRVSYVLNKELDSGFNFQVSLGKPAKRGLEYELGIGLKPEKKKLLLFGSWRIFEKLGLLFEMPYEEGKIRSIVFGAECRIANRTNLELKLRNNLHKELGINLKLNKSILNGCGDIFLQALKDGKDVTVKAGIGFKW